MLIFFKNKISPVGDVIRWACLVKLAVPVARWFARVATAESPGHGWPCQDRDLVTGHQENICGHWCPLVSMCPCTAHIWSEMRTGFSGMESLTPNNAWIKREKHLFLATIIIIFSLYSFWLDRSEWEVDLEYWRQLS